MELSCSIDSKILIWYFTDDQVPLEAKDAMEQNGIIVETVPR